MQIDEEVGQESPQIPLTPEQRRKQQQPFPAEKIETINIEFNQKSTQEAQQIFFHALLLVNFMVFLCFFTYAIQKFYDDETFSSAWIILTLLSFEIVSILETIILPLKYKRMRQIPEFIREKLTSSLTRVFLYLGIIFYITGNIEVKNLDYFVYPDFVLHIMASCRGHSSQIKTLNFLTTICFFSIIYFIQSGSTFTLLFGFLFFFIPIFFLVIFLSSYIFALVVTLKIYIWTPSQLNNIYPNFRRDFWKIFSSLLFFCGWFFVFTLGYSFLIIGCYSGIQNGILENNKKKSFSLYFGSQIVLWFALFHLLVILFFLINNKKEVFEIIEKFQNKEIIVRKFSKSINLDFIQKGVNYFIKRDEKNEGLLDTSKGGLDLTQPPECQICLTNFCDTLFEPCGHYITCQVCLNDYFKTSVNCLLCKKKIERVHLIYFDSETKRYKSEGTYEIKA